MTLSIFLSHSVADVEMIEEINKGFTKKDVTFYVAEQDVKPGSYLVDKIKIAIEKCDLFVALISKNGSRSSWVQVEIGIAIANNKLVIPILEKGVSPPDQLLGREYIKYDPDKPEDVLDSLDDFLSKLEGYITSRSEERICTTTRFIRNHRCYRIGHIRISAAHCSPTF